MRGWLLSGDFFFLGEAGEKGGRAVLERKWWVGSVILPSVPLNWAALCLIFRIHIAAFSCGNLDMYFYCVFWGGGVSGL